MAAVLWDHPSEPDNDSHNTQRGGLRKFGTGLRAENLFLKKGCTHKRMLEKCKGVVYPDAPAHSEHYIANGASGSAIVCAGLPK